MQEYQSHWIHDVQARLTALKLELQKDKAKREAAAAASAQ